MDIISRFKHEEYEIWIERIGGERFYWKRKTGSKVIEYITSRQYLRILKNKKRNEAYN